MSERILVIDDHAETLRLIKLILQRQGYEVDTADTGLGGIEQALLAMPDLVLLDIMMPGLSGLDVCRRFRESDELVDVPIVMFTARSQIEDKTEAFEAGANDYIVKPTRPQELVERVQASLAHYANASVVDGAAVSAETNLNGKKIAIIGANNQFDTAAVTTSLAALFANKQHPTKLIANPEQPPFAIDGVDWVSNEEIGAAMLDGYSAILQLSSAITDEDKQLLSFATDVVVCLTPDVMSISSAQKQIESLQEIIGNTTRLHAVLVDFSGSVSVPSDTASTFLKYPLLTTVAVNADHLAAARAEKKDLIHSYPNTTTADHFRKLHQLLSGPVA